MFVHSRKLFVALIIVVWSVSASASDEPLAGLDTAIEAARVQWGAPGLAVAIVKDERVVFAQGFGSRHLGENAPVDVHTLFTLASTTKAFVASALGILVDDGRLKWDDPVIRYVPEFRVTDPYVTREVTIRDLLVHRTGIEEMDILWLRGFGARAALERMQNARQSTSLRSTWAYNNMMYVVAAEVVARVAGMKFEDFVAQRIFAPARMTDSTFTNADLVKRANVTGAHLIVNGAARKTAPYLSESPLGAAGIQSSAADMAKWLQLLLNEGRVADQAVIKAETVAEGFKPQMLLANIGYPAARHAQPHFYAYGFGWFLQDYQGRLVAMHTGSLYGANALAAVVPEENLGLVILINAGPVEYRHAFMYDVIDRFLGTRNRDWNAELHQVYADLQAEEDKSRAATLKGRAVKTRPSAPLEAFAGTYSNPVVGDVEIVRGSDGALALVMKPDATFTLSHWSYDTFEASDDRAPEDGFLMTFTRGADGRITGYRTPGGRAFQRR